MSETSPGLAGPTEYPPDLIGDRIGRVWIVGGRVQGVGFRPFAATLAKNLGIRGSIRHHGGEVEIIAAGSEQQLGAFLRGLLADHPSMARPEIISAGYCPVPDLQDFQILASSIGASGGIVPFDIPPCDACRAEMMARHGRRSRYPFISCTACGPRYTSLIRLPFDRATTGMAEFDMCAACATEYGQAGDRRFHAQLIACEGCGPVLSFNMAGERADGNVAALACTVAILRQGAIVAVRGIGGYHLMCDATDDAAVLRLRARKSQPTKPFAVMFPHVGADGLDDIRQHCTIDPASAASLASAERPIVVVPRRGEQGPHTDLSPNIAPGLTELGVLSPYSPLHELLLAQFGGPLVATSGNMGGEPVLTDLTEAERLLVPIADAFLHHNRPIFHPADDAVVRIIAGEARVLRIGRGNAPLGLTLRRKITNPILALGGRSRVTLALGFGSRVVMSPHIGDLDSQLGLDRLERTAETFQQLHDITALSIVGDVQSAYSGTRWALDQSGLPLLRIPHHHAHASALAGEFTEEPRWLCFTWDGAGLGEDGTLWGGEALLGSPGSWRRAATFRSFSPPGGDKTAREPWRSAAALAWEIGLDWSPPVNEAVLARLAWQKRLDSPSTSSVGHLFDAAAACLGIAQVTSFDDEAAMALETISTEPGHADPLGLRQRPDGLIEADWEPLIAMLRDETQSVGRRAATFHAILAQTLVAQTIAVGSGQDDFAVGLTGGVFQNRRLSEACISGLRAAGFRAYLPQIIPCNDAGLSFGQIIEATALQ